MDHHMASFSFIFGLFKHQRNLQHLVPSAEIQTHDLWNMSLIR